MLLLDVDMTLFPFVDRCGSRWGGVEVGGDIWNHMGVQMDLVFGDGLNGLACPLSDLGE